jgi:hypothetical protein
MMRFRVSIPVRVPSGIRSLPWRRILPSPRVCAGAAGAALLLTLAGAAIASIVPGHGATGGNRASAPGHGATGGNRASAPDHGPGGTAGSSSKAGAPGLKSRGSIGSDSMAAAPGLRSRGVAGNSSMASASDSARASAAGISAPTQPAHNAQAGQAGPGTSPPQRSMTNSRPSTAGSAQPGQHTSCRSVAHIGDSTSVDLISSAFIPDPALQLPARYASVGVQHQLMDASGGRSVVEALPGQVNGYNVAQAWWNHGYRGCWVFALGTNDTANVSVGSAVGLAGRIDEMMSAAHGEPVLWVNTVTMLNSGPWSGANEQLWDSALVSALARYPNMRILNWAAVAQPGWFLPDGIHYNGAGSAARAQAIAEGLARAFPRYGHSVSQIVL